MNARLRRVQSVRLQGLAAVAAALALASGTDATASPKPKRAARIIAVFDLEVKKGLLEPRAADALADTLATWMGEGGRFRVVPRSDLRKALADKKRESYKDCFAESCQIEIGQALAADATLATRVARIGRRCVVNLKIYDLRTEATIASTSERGGCSEDSLLYSLEDAARRLTGVRGNGPTDRAAPREPARRVPKGWARLKKRTVRVGDLKVEAGPIRVQRTEVTARSYRRCVEAGVCNEDSLSGLSTCTYGRPRRADHPLNCVSWRQADQYCRWTGGRLPTEAEWVRATYRGRAKFPWGSKGFRSGKPANVADTTARRRYHLGDADTTYDDGHSDTAQVGSFPDGRTRPGVYDLVGNVAEWTTTWNVEGRTRVIRGGSWRTPVTEASSRTRGSLDTTSREDDVGFRCVKDLKARK